MTSYTLILPTLKLVEVIDVLLVCLFSYHLYRLLKGSVAVKIILGFLVLYILGWSANQLGMSLVSHLLTGFTSMVGIAVVVIFQYEIRKFLSSLGGLFFWGGRQFLIQVPWGRKKDALALNITALVEACKILGGSNMGGLMVLSSTEDLKFYIESGDLLDALISKRLLMAIFNKESPLHDGAIIIYQARIIAARCILPVTERQNIPAHFGLRHRAAIGMSEITDTLVIVVSEETGQISVARKGFLQPNLSAQELRLAINEYLKE